MGHRAPGDQGQIRALAKDIADIQWQGLAVIGDLVFGHPVNSLGFEKHDRVGAANTGQQEAISAGWRGWDHHAYARHVGEYRFGAFGMMLGCVDAAAKRRSQHHRTAQTAPGPVAHATGMTDHLVDGRINEAHKLYFGDRLETLGRHADRDPGQQVFRERRIHDPIRTEFFLQTRRCAENSTVDANVLAENHDAVVMFHFPGHRHRDGFDQGNLGHQ